MKLLFTSLLLTSLLSMNAWSSESPELLKRLKEAQLSLLDGVEQIEYDHGPTISAKFEIKRGILKLSAYTVQKGMNTGAEKNPLLELIGDATGEQWNPDRVEFADKPHIARASVQLALLQLGKYSFKDVVQKSLKQQPGMVYSVKPKLIKGSALVEVKILTKKGQSKTMFYDLINGNISCSL